MESMKGNEEKMLGTQERIAIAQCINLAVETLVGANIQCTDEVVKKEAKRYYKIKEDLEQEYRAGTL